MTTRPGLAAWDGALGAPETLPRRNQVRADERSPSAKSPAPTGSTLKNDHLGFEVLYVYRGVVRKYRPDFIIRLNSGTYLVLETKGKDSEQNQTKHRFLDEWVNAVNAHGGFGRWCWDVSRDPGDIMDILARHSQTEVA